jgi:hypothetical protein
MSLDIPNVPITFVLVRRPGQSRFLAPNEEKAFHREVEYRETLQDSVLIPWMQKDDELVKIEESNDFRITRTVLDIQRHLHNKLDLAFKDLLDIEMWFVETKTQEEKSPYVLHRYPPHARTSVDHSSILLDTMVESGQSHQGTLHPLHLFVFALVRDPNPPSSGLSELVNRYLLIENQQSERYVQSQRRQRMFSFPIPPSWTMQPHTTRAPPAQAMEGPSALESSMAPTITHTGPHVEGTAAIGSVLRPSDLLGHIVHGMGLGSSLSSMNAMGPLGTHAGPVRQRMYSPQLPHELNERMRHNEQERNSHLERLRNTLTPDTTINNRVGASASDQVDEDLVNRYRDLDEQRAQERARARDYLVPPQQHIFPELFPRARQPPGGPQRMHIPEDVEEYVINNNGLDTVEMFRNEPALQGLYGRMMNNLMNIAFLAGRNPVNFHELLEPVRVTVDNKDLHEFVQYSAFKDVAEQITKLENQENCPICLEKFADEDPVAFLRTCEHLFHEQCVKKWLLEFNHRCPVCRTSVDPSKNEPADKK